MDTMQRRALDVSIIPGQPAFRAGHVIQRSRDDAGDSIAAQNRRADGGARFRKRRTVHHWHIHRHAQRASIRGHAGQALGIREERDGRTGVFPGIEPPWTYLATGWRDRRVSGAHPGKASSASRKAGNSRKYLENSERELHKTLKTLGVLSLRRLQPTVLMLD